MLLLINTIISLRVLKSAAEQQQLEPSERARFPPMITTHELSFTGHIGLLPLYEAGQLVAHSFVQSSRYLEQKRIKSVVTNDLMAGNGFVD